LVAAKNLVFNITELAMEGEASHHVKNSTDLLYRLLAAPFIPVGLLGFAIAGTLRTLGGVASHFSAGFNDWYEWKTPEPPVPFFSRRALARIPGAVFGVTFALIASVFSGVGLFITTLAEAFGHGYDLQQKYASSDKTKVYPILAYPLQLIANLFGYPIGMLARGVIECGRLIRIAFLFVASQVLSTLSVLPIVDTTDPLNF
jgi:hypothetical protein